MQITAIITVTIAHIFALFLGIFFIFTNLRPSTSFPEEVEKGNLKFYRSYGALWRDRLLAWHVIDNESTISAVRKEIITAWELIEAPSQIAGGITLLLYASGFLLLLVLSKGTIIGDKQNAPLLSPLLFVLWLGSVVGNGMGYILGFWRTRQESRRKVTYADLRQRRISDYRSNLFRWLLGLIVFLNVSLFLLLPSLFGSQPSTFAWASAIIMFIIFIMAESFMPRIVTMPRLIVTPDPRVAQHADDLLRALVIAELHWKLIIGMASLLYIQWLFFFGWLQSSPLFIAIQVAATLLLLLCLFLSGMRTSDKGHLGGRITGWSWHKLAF